MDVFFPAKLIDRSEDSLYLQVLNITTPANENDKGTITCIVFFFYIELY